MNSHLRVKPGLPVGSRLASFRRIMAPAYAVTVTCLFAAYGVSGCRGQEQIQPINYSHKAHVETAGLSCVDCHQSAESGVRASIPPLETCSGCHSEEPVTQSPEEVRLLEFVRTGTEVPWKKVYSVPDHVYFSHRRHVSGGAVSCQECHGDVGSFTTAISTPYLPVTMERCMACHKERSVSNDCLSCHR